RASICVDARDKPAHDEGNAEPSAAAPGRGASGPCLPGKFRRDLELTFTQTSILAIPLTKSATATCPAAAPKRFVGGPCDADLSGAHTRHALPPERGARHRTPFQPAGLCRCDARDGRGDPDR